MDRHDRDTDSPRRPRIGRYEIQGVIGRGGQGVVYLARDPELGRKLAIKVRHTTAGAPDATSAMRLVREARLGARLLHPGICPVADYGVHRGRFYVAMPYLEGWSLRELLDASAEGQGDAGIEAGHDGEVDDARAAVLARLGLVGDRCRITGVVELMTRVSAAIAAAHAAGIIHRDLKPRNILVQPDGEPVVLDLGLAKDQRDERLPTLTGAGDLLGTPAYIAPEQLQQAGAVGPAADVWALGAVLYECLTGSRPFLGPSRERLYLQVLESEPPRLRGSRHLARVPRDLQAIVDVALHKDPRRRYATAAELLEDLRRFACRQPVRARSRGRLGRLGLWIRRNPVAAAAMAGLALCLATALVTVVLLLREQEQNARLTVLRYHHMGEVTYDIVYELTRQLALVPGVEETRRRLIERVLGYLDQLRGHRPEEPAVRAQIVAARIALGDLLGNPDNENLGQQQRALEQYELALRGAQALVGCHSATVGEADVLRYLASSRQRLGRLYLALRRPADARPQLLVARQRLGEATGPEPGGLQDRYLRFQVDRSLARCALQLGDPDVLDLRQRVLASADAVVEGCGDDRRSAEILAEATAESALVCIQLGQVEEALDRLRRRLPWLRDMVGRWPDSVPLQRTRNESAFLACHVLVQQGRLQEARPICEAALGTPAERGARDARANRDPHQLRLRYGFYFTHACILSGLGQPAESLQEFDAARRMCEAFLRLQPTDPHAHAVLCDAQLHRSRLLSAAGRHGGACAAARDGVQVARARPGELPWNDESLTRRARAELQRIRVLCPAGRCAEAVEVAREAREFFAGQLRQRPGCVVSTAARDKFARVAQQLQQQLAAGENRRKD